MTPFDARLKALLTPETFRPEKLLHVMQQIRKFDDVHQLMARKALGKILRDSALLHTDIEWKIDHAIRSIRSRFIRATGAFDEIEAEKHQRRSEKLRRRLDLSKKISRYLDEEAESGSETEASRSEDDTSEKQPKRSKNKAAKPIQEVSLDEAFNLLD